MDQALVVLSYLGGSVSFPVLFARAKGIDLRRSGSRKLGGSNLIRQAGVRVGVAAGVLDGLKGLTAVLVARALGLPLEIQLACGIAAVAGQLWPVFHGFDGGRANATGWGFAIAADGIAALIMAIPVVSALLLRAAVPSHPTRLLPIGALASFVVWPAVIWEQEGTTPQVLAGLAVLALVVLRRLTAGLRDDLATGAPLARILANRALFDRTELQTRGVVAVS
ncbi:MAG: glycerol-3-phosphate acyltransferase [Candidatus Limnocylindria bacterium]|nr:glycerol-3-phosphate acyltransferase [Candidatus Limnocylindria bacterium]